MNLDELKKKLLAALPPAIREKLGVELDEDLDEDDLEEVDGDEPTDSHDLEKIKSSGDDDEESDEDDDEEEDDEEAEKKAKKTKIIRIIVMCAIAFFILDEFMAENDSGVEEVPVVAKPTMTPVKKAAMLLKKQKEEEAKKSALESASEEESQSSAEAEIEQTPVSIETPVMAEEEPSYDSSYEQNQEPEEVPPETPVVVLTPAQEKPVVETPTPSIDLGMDEEDTKKESSLDMLMKAVDKSEEMTETNMKNSVNRDDPTYIQPPNYLRSGRGLVYNCKENHWACVDKFSYFTCYENQNWNKENDQSTECITRDVYASAGDCAAIQKFYVNKPEPTDFCGKSKEQSGSDDSQPTIQEQDDLSNLVAP